MGEKIVPTDVSGVIENWTKPKEYNGGAFIKLSIKGIQYTVFADKLDTEPMITFGNLVSNIPAQSVVEFKARMGEYNGKPQGAIVPQTIKILSKGPTPAGDTPKEMIAGSTGRRTANEETIGKVRHGVALAFIEQGATLHKGTVKEIDEWVTYIMTGKQKEKEKTPTDTKEILKEVKRDDKVEPKQPTEEVVY